MKKNISLIAIYIACCVSILHGHESPRLRDLGIEIGIFAPGRFNAITDVAGVRVGHLTLIKGDSIRTGVTAILPHGGNLFAEKVPAAVVVGNGFGKLIGSTQISELGNIETPIVLTNTLSVWDAAIGTVNYMLAIPENSTVGSINPVVGETNDGYLNDIRARHVTAVDVVTAITMAKGGEVAEGCVGAGTGTVCFGWKGGIGTSSRVLPEQMGGFTIGVLVQTNFGGILDIAGVPVGKELGRYSFKEQLEKKSGGSCMVVVATDATLSVTQLGRLARRATLGLGRTGSMMSHGSGDYVIAFSTSVETRIKKAEGKIVRTMPVLNDEFISPLFQATIEATEEAIVNSLFKATTMTGFRGNRVEALPLEKVKEIMRAHGRLR